MELSILIPCYNEEATLSQVLEQVIQATRELSCEILLIDDGSTDNTLGVAREFEGQIRVLAQEKNQGKGEALKRGLLEARGRFVFIQDADLEYSPRDYPQILQPLLQNQADVVYGSRFLKLSRARSRYWSFWLGNRFLTVLSNLLSGFSLTDMETCYKAFRRDLLDWNLLQEKGFGIEPELTMRFSRIPDLRILEVPISYYGRTVEEGKKIKWVDGVKAVWHLIRYRFLTK